MELEKQPKTEMEYWELIEGLGAFSWKMDHDISDGRIDDPTGEIAKDIKDARKIQHDLALGLSEKFGVILPRDCPKVETGQPLPTPPEGKIFYKEWYDNMKHKSYQIEYEGLICSACPFSTGLEKMISGGEIPCGVVSGWFNRLLIPHECGMVNNIDEWTKEELYKKILKKSGKKVLLAFQAKEKELKEKPKTEPQ